MAKPVLMPLDNGFKKSDFSLALVEHLVGVDVAQSVRVGMIAEV